MAAAALDDEDAIALDPRPHASPPLLPAPAAPEERLPVADTQKRITELEVELSASRSAHAEVVAALKASHSDVSRLNKELGNTKQELEKLNAAVQAFTRQTTQALSILTAASGKCL